MGALPGSPLVQWMVRKEPERVIKGSPGGPGAPGGRRKVAERAQLSIVGVPNYIKLREFINDRLNMSGRLEIYLLPAQW